MCLRTALGEILFWLHLPVVVMWVGLFFIPSSIWPGKITFHFWFIVCIFTSQLLWGLVLLPLRRRLGFGVCPLTTLTQYVRGYPVRDPRNYDHWFLDEMCERWNMRLPHRIIQTIFLGTITLICIQYFSR